MEFFIFWTPFQAWLSVDWSRYCLSGAWEWVHQRRSMTSPSTCTTSAPALKLSVCTSLTPPLQFPTLPSSLRTPFSKTLAAQSSPRASLHWVRSSFWIAPAVVGVLWFCFWNLCFWLSRPMFLFMHRRTLLLIFCSRKWLKIVLIEFQSFLIKFLTNSKIFIRNFIIGFQVGFKYEGFVCF